jgi:hypothetical protein
MPAIAFKVLRQDLPSGLSLRGLVRVDAKGVTYDQRE